MGGGGGGTSISVPPEIGQIGQKGLGLGDQMHNFLGQPISMGNYALTLATGGNVPQAVDPYLNVSPSGNPAVFDLNAGNYIQPTNEPGQDVVGAPFNWYYPTAGGAAMGEQGASQFQSGGYGTPQQGIGEMGGTMFSSGGGPSGPGFYMQNPNNPEPQWVPLQGAQTQQQAMAEYQSMYPGSTLVQQGAGPGQQSPRMTGAEQPGGAGQPTWQAVAQAAGLKTQDIAQFQKSGLTPAQVAKKFGVTVPTAPTNTWSPTEQVGGVTVPTENPLYGPWLNSFASSVQHEAGMVPQMEQAIGQLGGINKFAEQQANYDIGQEKALASGNLLPSQQAYVTAAVKAGQSGVQQQLASEGMGASTLGPELNAEIGLQGAATAGQLAQGNISLSQAWGSAAQAWTGLATGATALTMEQQKNIASLFSTIGQQTAGVQSQLWNQALQGYGLEAAFVNNTLAPYQLSLSAYNDILQASEAQAQINERQNEASMQETASIVGSVLSLVGSVAGAKICWVARMVIPERWTEFREWLLLSAPSWFRNFYIDHGESIATFISNKPILKKIIRWVFLGILKHG